MLIPENKIRALIRLLSDEDDRIVQTISGRLIDIGPSAVPLLQEAEIEQPEMADRITSVLEEIRGGKLEDELTNLATLAGEAMCLETGAFLIARYAYPTLDVAHYRERLDTMAGEVRARIGCRASGEEAINALNRYLFTEQGFKGNTKNYYEVENSYLNCVMDRRVGIPISLSAVYLFLGQRLRLPVFGIGMPGHFLVKYESDRYKIFIDCFNGGALLTEKNCARFLTEAGYGFDDKYLQKSPIRAILSRMVKNLLAIYSKAGDAVKTDRLTKFIEILGGAPREEGL
ncbi:MAG: transglutaminase-like domain-containing protein [Nitrospira sp.]|nr:transglutaminase-like domain-containing protein [Nitrospira sp.]MDH4369292.1 transglutaminase-like domain-containing protein [Nitrospira sp.]MDH5347245.1 transglutaminase-like domain-containing protein [Nitrospira sp.]MDH5497688.1 transglutaminase-like domain-containing protein [Nitrospira sp.]MDH5725956.1 transglutaminase-like domain-containing protein [Nitrospira sp.]